MKVQVPALKSHMGDWDYFLCSMRLSEVAKQIDFFHNLQPTEDLSLLLQRGLHKRSDDIKKYLIESDHRFLGSMIIAVWGGAPKFTSLKMDVGQKGEIAGDIDEQFGVLTFDGTQQFFALDGQHRLQAIKDAILLKPELKNDFISIILVQHSDDKEGRIRTRRLFTNVNKNAKKTSIGEDIVLDEDDGIAMITRQLISEHKFLSDDNRVKIFGRRGDQGIGNFTIAAKTISKTDPHSFTTIVTLYNIVKGLSFDLPDSITKRSNRPTNDEIEKAYKKISLRIDSLISEAGNIGGQIRDDKKDFSQIRNGEQPGYGHPFARPIVQIALSEVVGAIMETGQLDWKSLMNRVSQLEWELKEPLWSCIYNQSKDTMLTDKDSTNLLKKMLHVHLAPMSAQNIRDALNEYRQVKDGKPWKGANENELKKLIIPSQ